MVRLLKIEQTTIIFAVVFFSMVQHYVFRKNGSRRADGTVDHVLCYTTERESTVFSRTITSMVNVVRVTVIFCIFCGGSRKGTVMSICTPYIYFIIHFIG